ncbi:MAG: hypothetical protein ACSHXL_04710 [Bacteroidota bacterium]
MIALNEINEHLIPIDEHIMCWMFEDENGCLSEESIDQIWGLTPEMSKTLWDYLSQVKMFKNYPDLTNYFKDVETFDASFKSDKEIKKWLHKRGIKYSTKVFDIDQPDIGFILTWKMVIKHYEILYSGDALFWDETLNWGLVCHHDGLFTFGKNRIYNDNEQQIRLTMLNKELRQQP